MPEQTLAEQTLAERSVPHAFHVMAKPSGAACNLHCDYCFYLKKDGLYLQSDFRMPEEVHEAYIKQLLESQRSPLVTVAWQGGEPTLIGLDFYERSIKMQKRYAKPGVRVENTFQTNGVLLTDEWCHFFRENNFLVGLSIDGPRELHDIYRKDKAGHGTFGRAERAVRLLQKHEVDFNILCAVHSKNAGHPLEVYRFFRDELEAQYIQFIPVVELDNAERKNAERNNIQRDKQTGFQEGNTVTDRSVRPEQWGNFLIQIFDEWVNRDVGRTFVLNFDAALAGWLGRAGMVCIFARTCGLSLALEHNGDLYSCDHFVEPDHLLGNILKTPMTELVGSYKQRKFGQDKWDTLSRSCRECDFLFACNGECPRNRLIAAPDGGPTMNYLCEGYKAFFTHADRAMKAMAVLIRNGRPAEEIMELLEGAGKGAI